ncbi:hypothetical protein [Ralstonia chuxiongensis]|uniref:Uncharacterized protein n=1 Tax=Ralstonia chuxiongensis TaxID=2957504 RepID=A0AA41WVT9_9RALS|nr:hypothetical protein [Ralstonia chuxiongensis]MCP1173754.1 hypothetical protein [Ralstonia chuxiongensis]
MDKNNGGPAFPMPGQCVDEKWEPIPGFTGMTLRDYFAAKAVGGMLACPVQPQSDPDMYARDAYVIADAMLKARGRHEPQ